MSDGIAADDVKDTLKKLEKTVTQLADDVHWIQESNHDIRRQQLELSEILIKINKNTLSIQRVLLHQYPIFLEFNKGRVIIELDYEECPVSSEFFLNIMKRGPVEHDDLFQCMGTQRTRRIDFRCNRQFDFYDSGDRHKVCDEFGLSSLGLAWFSCDENETIFTVSRGISRPDEIRSFFGKVAHGKEMLEQLSYRSGDQSQLVLLNYGCVM